MKRYLWVVETADSRGGPWSLHVVCKTCSVGSPQSKGLPIQPDRQVRERAMNQRIGTCSICGGDVMGWFGAWGAVIPPPAPKCAVCGAVPKGSSDVIEMELPRAFQIRRRRSPDWSID